MRKHAELDMLCVHASHLARVNLDDSYGGKVTPMKLKDKVCIVTGAASGIGKEIALTSAREGGKAVMPHLQASGRGGSIIYMGSVHSKKVMLKENVDGEFTTVQDVAEVALVFAGFGSNALTGQSLVVSHGWFMQ